MILGSSRAATFDAQSCLTSSALRPAAACASVFSMNALSRESTMPAVEPGIELGEEEADGLDEDAAGNPA